jgi:hypothetical protein
MAKITHQQMYENRLKAVEYLEQPQLRKAREQLRDNKGGRCCLGHMCDAFPEAISTEKNGGQWLYGKDKEPARAPKELVDLLGMYTSIGGTKDFNMFMNDKGEYPFGNTPSLAEVNDQMRVSPQAIGKYLRSVILGGPNTPWKKIKVAKAA